MDAEFGAAVAALTERDLASMRAMPRKQAVQQPEVKEGAVIARLFKAALPQLKHDAKVLQRINAQNAQRSR
jgi:hypothetical protein